MASFMRPRWVFAGRLKLTQTGVEVRRETRVTLAMRGSSLPFRARTRGRRWGGLDAAYPNRFAPADPAPAAGSVSRGGRRSRRARGLPGVGRLRRVRLQSARA